ICPDNAPDLDAQPGGALSVEVETTLAGPLLSSARGYFYSSRSERASDQRYCLRRAALRATLHPCKYFERTYQAGNVASGHQGARQPPSPPTARASTPSLPGVNEAASIPSCPRRPCSIGSTRCSRLETAQRRSARTYSQSRGSVSGWPLRTMRTTRYVASSRLRRRRPASSSLPTPRWTPCSGCATGGRSWIDVTWL